MPEVPTGQPDQSPPTLHLGSAGLRADIDLNQTSTQPVSRRAARSSSILLRTKAEDLESGIARIELRGELIIECIPTASNTMVRIRDPIAVEGTGGPSSLPVSRTISYGFTVADQITRCPAATRFYQLVVSLMATARSGAGLEQGLPEARVRAFGPDVLRVATFNLYNPGRHPDSQYAAWGTAIGDLADVVLLTEVPDRRRAEILAGAAGMPYVVTLQDSFYTDVAIASRTPLRDVVRRRVSSGPRGHDSNILSAMSDIGNFPHQFVVNHWAIRDADGTIHEPNRTVSIVGRRDAANTVVGLLTKEDVPIVVGGDLNAIAVLPEVVRLTDAGLSDALVSVPMPPETTCDGDQRIDFLFSGGPIAPSSYNDYCPNSTFASGSDHPFVVVKYVPR